ncbi:MAG: ATP-dependent helicase [Chitinophagaceae bacterium]|nr:ATP-dependent helicase [Chitinophagaceae bacterium]MBK9465505.1 ATP-dependent helicase [Chitinophagaceae bacterium]MBP6232799.1 ATP-dependent helicase [Chitinophagaceae bacterium]MBP6415276.1 ATP-dependent helicase [Chitinophagaceae bacterium]HQW42732.1 ATP-dependent DNA helicase [Chitinophagaceae bacterium]
MSFNKERLESKFKEEYERLNEKQRIAVDTIDGPVMVIAGPGTGKTQILASRIGKILLDTDAQPENILCLTYTEAGVVAMRRRLLNFIGPNAYKVNICTFHAFCNDVIQDNLSLFEKTALDPVSDLEKIQFFKELIDSFPKNHLLKRYRGDVYFEINNLQSLFSNMKKEGWTPSFINQKIDDYLANLPTRDEFIYKRKYKEFNAGDLKRDKIQEEQERMEKLRAAVGEFDRFQQLMRKKNRYDFDDMINWVIKAFEENKNLLANYQEKYQYILVDEYQDTSGTQNRLVELLISYWEKPNVFVVGDDDQSIYRFQGANVENMLDFAANYQNDLLTVVLTNNYRSTQPILDISKTLINRNDERLVKKIEGLSKELLSTNQLINQLTNKPFIREYDTQRQEMIGIAKQVQDLVGQQVPPGKIGIIYKENKYGEELAQYFKLLNIPVYSKRHLNILELSLGQKIMLVLKYLASEHDISYSGDEMLFEILHFDWFGIPSIEIAKISMEVAEKRYKDDKTSIRQLLVEKSLAPAKDLFSSNLHGGLKKTSAIIEQLVTDVSNVTLQHLFENIIREAGVLSHIMQSPDKHWQLQILTGLFDFVKDETHRNPTLNLQGFVNLIEMMEKEDIKLPLVQVSGSDKGVNLMTAHGSKGLEFEYVLLVGCNSSFWEKKRKPGGGYKLPDTMFTSLAGTNDEEELRRLFYVAITRAEQHLYISYSKFKNDGKELEPSMFIAEIQDEHQLPIEKIIIDTGVLSEFAALHFIEAQAPEIDKIEEEYIGQLLDKFVMNVTALNNYLKCPLEFYFKNLVRIPSPKNEATEFGSAVHHALEKLFRKMQDGKKDTFEPKEEFIGDFVWYIERHRESFTREQYARRLEYGQEVLSHYYDKYISSFNKIVTIERRIKTVYKDVPLKGALDKLEFDGKSVNVVDYKSGDPDKGIPKTKGPSDKDPNGGDYWRQAVFYKILVDNYEQKDWKVVSTEFDFIEPDKKKNYRKEKVVISPVDIITVTQQITDTWEKIQNRDFYTGCGKEDCHWCNFVKTNNLAIALHSLEEEPTED